MRVLPAFEADKLCHLYAEELLNMVEELHRRSLPEANSVAYELLRDDKRDIVGQFTRNGSS